MRWDEGWLLISKMAPALRHGMTQSSANIQASQWVEWFIGGDPSDVKRARRACVQVPAEKQSVKVLGGVACFEAMISPKKRAGSKLCCHKSRPRCEAFIRSDTLDDNGGRHTTSGTHGD